jgi:predicted AAA+ superfamily ATPase
MDETYLPRIADRILTKKLEASGAVYIAGPKWCGKTSTAEQLAKSALYMQDPDRFAVNMQMADTKPSLLLDGEKPRLLDEWQVAPVLWDAVRFAVDKSKGKCGQYILTGSAAAPDNATMHTGTGRIDRMTMRPMSLYESQESSGQVSLKSLFDGSPDIEGIAALSIESIEKLAFILTRGGWPFAIGKPADIAVSQVYKYIDATINSDASKIDGVQRDPDRIRSLMRSLARNISTQASVSTIRADMRGDDEGLSENTVLSYLNVLSKLFVVEDLRAWNPSIRSKTAVRTSPTRHFVDPSIAAAVLGVDASGLLKDFNTFGLLFESLCIRDLRVYAEAIGGAVYHYRDSYGLETDAVVQLKDGRWGAVEVKMGSKETEKACENLLKLQRTVNTEKMNDPSFLTVLTASNYAYRRKDGVYIVPIGCLKD